MNSWLNRFRIKHPRFFLSKKETRALSRLIEEFESFTGCEIVFNFRRHLGVDPMAQAAKLFVQYGLEKTKHRAAILIVISLKDRKYAVFTDKNVAIQSDDKVWHTAGNILKESLNQNQRLGALVSIMEYLKSKLGAGESHGDFVLSNKPKVGDD